MIKIFYIFDLKINLLFEWYFIKYNFKENFDDNNLYIYIKKKIEIFFIFVCDDIYIMNKFASQLNKFALSIITFINIESFLLIIISIISKLKKLSSNSKI